MRGRRTGLARCRASDRADAPPLGRTRGTVGLLAAAVFVLIAAAGVQARAACPSYTVGTGTHHCGVPAVAATNPSADEWQKIFGLVAGGPAKWGSRGPSVPDLKSGCGATEKKVPATFPCEILKALARKESNWKQFCAPSEPATQKGLPSQTIISFDCGYGVSQVTSGMHEGETTTFDRAKVAADPVYNLAAGAGLLAQKWQGARCLATRDPGIIEHWYVALWKYNGYSYSNDPSNPIFSSTRGIYDPAVGGAAPYQEKVFGIIEKGSSGGKLWKPIALAYPRIEDVAGRRSEPVAKIECGSPTDCSPGALRTTHRSLCTLTEATGVAPPPDAGVPTTNPRSADASAPHPPDSRDGATADAPRTPTASGSTNSGRGGHGGCACSTARWEADWAGVLATLVAAGLSLRRRRSADHAR
jgi:hypothetical protein